MTRRSLLAALALFATAAHAQTDAISAAFDAHNAEYGVEPVAGPFVGQFVEEGDGDDSTWEVNLEAGSYVLLLHAAPGSGLDPDAWIFDANGGEVASGSDLGESEMIWFTAEAPGTYRVELPVCCSGGAMPLGAAIYLDDE